MCNSNVIDKSELFGERLRNNQISERLNEYGFEMGSTDQIPDSEIKFYILDTNCPAVLAYGFDREFLLDSEKRPEDWAGFLSSWAVIKNPEMSSSVKNIEVTQLHGVLALAGLKNWSTYRELILREEELTKPHVIIIVDEKKFDGPLDIVVARSSAVLMNADSLKAILKSYIKG